MIGISRSKAPLQTAALVCMGSIYVHVVSCSPGLQIRRKILSILDSIDLSLDVPGKLDLEVIDNAMAEQVIAGCETRNEQGVVLCNLKLLHRILTAELNNLQGSSALGQRSRLEEVSSLSYFSICRVWCLGCNFKGLVVVISKVV